jgi:deoxyribodipyrimidine photolyase-related protein
MNYIIFPNQLFYNIKHIDKKSNIYLIEEPRYFTDFKFHKLKLAYHRATMKKYFDYLKKKKYNIKYIEFHNIDDHFYTKLKEITFINPVDNKLLKKLKKLCNCNILDTQLFLISEKEINDNKNKFLINGKYRNDNFYKLNIHNIL